MAGTHRPRLSLSCIWIRFYIRSWPNPESINPAALVRRFEVRRIDLSRRHRTVHVAPALSLFTMFSCIQLWIKSNASYSKQSSAKETKRLKKFREKWEKRKKKSKNLASCRFHVPDNLVVYDQHWVRVHVSVPTGYCISMDEFWDWYAMRHTVRRTCFPWLQPAFHVLIQPIVRVWIKRRGPDTAFLGRDPKTSYKTHGSWHRHVP